MRDSHDRLSHHSCQLASIAGVRFSNKVNHKKLNAIFTVVNRLSYALCCVLFDNYQNYRPANWKTASCVRSMHCEKHLHVTWWSSNCAHSDKCQIWLVNVSLLLTVSNRLVDLHFSTAVNRSFHTVAISYELNDLAWSHTSVRSSSCRVSLYKWTSICKFTKLVELCNKSAKKLLNLWHCAQ